jgi:putative Ca2+/H+ antiporter (TMEM165/GDT1 family)
MARAAEFDAPIMVFVGVVLALALLTAIGIAVGVMISRFVPMRYIEIGSSVVFIVFGILFLARAWGKLYPQNPKR